MIRRLNAFADFSGRGGGNAILSQTGSGRAGGRHPCTRTVGGGYTGVTGTSFATPFVTAGRQH